MQPWHIDRDPNRETERNREIAGSIDVTVEAPSCAIDHALVEHIAELVLETLET